jgi:hypothetical protein
MCCRSTAVCTGPSEQSRKQSRKALLDDRGACEFPGVMQKSAIDWIERSVEG